MTRPDWKRCAHELPERSGVYLLWDDRECHMWIGVWRDGRRYIEADQDTERVGWHGQGDDPTFWPTHWAELPRPPNGPEAA